MGRIRVVGAAALSGLALASIPTSAGAVTVGQLDPVTPATGSCATADRDIHQSALTSGNTYVVPPFGATITSWSHNARIGIGQTLTFKVFRKVAEPSTYLLVGLDGPRTLDPGVLNTFPVRIAVKPGDVIGLNTANADVVDNACLFVTGAGDEHLFRTPGLALGEQNTFNPQPNSRVNVTAEVLPDDRFELGKAKLNKKKGTATFAVTVPGPGELTLTGKKVKVQSPAVTAPGEYKLTVKAKGKTKKKLSETGKATVSTDISYTPTGGTLRVRNEHVKLRKKL